MQAQTGYLMDCLVLSTCNSNSLLFCKDFNKFPVNPINSMLFYFWFGDLSGCIYILYLE